MTVVGPKSVAIEYKWKFLDASKIIIACLFYDTAPRLRSLAHCCLVAATWLVAGECAAHQVQDWRWKDHPSTFLNRNVTRVEKGKGERECWADVTTSWCWWSFSMAGWGFAMLPIPTGWYSATRWMSNIRSRLDKRERVGSSWKQKKNEKALW